MSIVIDTSVAIHLRDRDPLVTAKTAELGGSIAMSIMSRVELEGGVYADRGVAAIRRARLDILLETIRVLPFDDGAADAYRRIVEAVGFSRRKAFDRMIAAQALASGATLVTLNGDDFRDVPGLTMLEW